MAKVLDKHEEDLSALHLHDRHTVLGLADDDLVGLYRGILLARRLDQKIWGLNRMGKAAFVVSCQGHEGAQVGSAWAIRAGHDVVLPYYRDTGVVLTLGMTPYDVLLGVFARADDPSSGGRQMPSHWGSRRLNIVSRSSPTGTQFLQAVGCAEADYRAELIGNTEMIQGYQADGVTYVSAGDGTTSEGEFFESLNSACNLKLPVVYLIEDNGYAISVPVEVQTAGGKISELVKNFPGLYIEEVDGCDPVSSY